MHAELWLAPMLPADMRGVCGLCRLRGQTAHPAPPHHPARATAGAWATVEAAAPESLPHTHLHQVSVAAPGIKPEDIKVTLDRGTLRVKGESRGTRDDGSTFYHKVEKMVTLPQHMIDADAVEACNEYGMLNICIPKKQQQQGSVPRTIKVKTGAA